MKASEFFRPREYDFQEKLAYSRGDSERHDIVTLEAYFHGARVFTASKDTDRDGGDYRVEGKRCTQFYVDAKARDPGCKKHWRDPHNPDLALEEWSVEPSPGNTGKIGWTLNRESVASWILFTFHPDDFRGAYIVPFLPLHRAFEANLASWRARFHHASQSSFTWRSHCVFVPASVVLAEVLKRMRMLRQFANPSA